MECNRATTVALTIVFLSLSPSVANAQFGESGSAEALIEDFVLYESRDPITDERETVLFTDSEGTIASTESLSELQSPAGQLELSSLLVSGAMLAIVCSGESSYPFPMVMNQETVWFESDTTAVTVRIGNSEPLETVWGATSSGIGIPKEELARKFMNRSKKARKVAVRYTDGAGAEHTHVFSLMGLTSGLKRMSCSF